MRHGYVRHALHESVPQCGHHHPQFPQQSLVRDLLLYGPPHGSVPVMFAAGSPRRVRLEVELCRLLRTSGDGLVREDREGVHHPRDRAGDGPVELADQLSCDGLVKAIKPPDVVQVKHILIEYSIGNCSIGD